MRREQRLRKESEFEAVRKRGRGWSSDILVLRTLSNGLPHSRFGYVVSKRIGGAVVRNLVRRRIREAVRLTGVAPGWDLVFIARVGVADAPYTRLAQTVRDLLRRARALDDRHPEGITSSGRV
ncbi:MAG: ribonuclease P protein component [Chloroflexota bacterium]